jgi:hypothetical protein
MVADWDCIGPILKNAGTSRRRKYGISTPVLAGLDPGIGYPQPIANASLAAARAERSLAAVIG